MPYSLLDLSPEKMSYAFSEKSQFKSGNQSSYTPTKSESLRFQNRIYIVTVGASLNDQEYISLNVFFKSITAHSKPFLMNLITSDQREVHQVLVYKIPRSYQVNSINQGNYKVSFQVETSIYGNIG